MQKLLKRHLKMLPKLSKMKNLLIIVPSYPDKNNIFIGGKFVKNQIEALKIYFNEIIVVAPVLSSLKLLQKDKICKNYKYDNVTVYYPRCLYISIFRFSKLLIDNRLIVIENLIKKENIEFDLIHAHFTWPSAYIAVKLKEIFESPVVLTIHENSGWFDKEVNMNNPLINNAWEKADALIRINEKDIPTLKIFNKNVFSITNGYPPQFKPLNKNECRIRLCLPVDKKILFSLGLLDERKGFNYLIDSMKIIFGTRNDVLCFIGGKGLLRDKLQKQINDMNLQNHVKLIGFIPDELLPIWMNACDIFVLPSLNEGNPTVMFECLGCGKPFIGTNVGGIPEIINNDMYGFIVKPANSDELAGAIERGLQKNWDEKSIFNYAKQYSWDNIVKEIVEIYHEVLKKE